MSYLAFSRTVISVAVVTFGMSAMADEATLMDDTVAATATLGSEGLKLVAKTEQSESANSATDALGGKDIQAEMAVLIGEADESTEEISAASTDDDRNKEEVWSEISQAISGLNDMVGDEMFRDLRRTDNNRMEVRVDLNYWQRVRYQTRVDLKRDISNIWHLYVTQYSDDGESSVFFIDDQSNKTIDIFTR